MEVHHHAHAHGKKKLKEYLAEFLMLFLAVTLGFLAENLREHQADHKKEKEYIASLVKDLKKDTTYVTRVNKLLLRNIQGEDSLISALQHYNNSDSVNKRIYRYFISYAVNVRQMNFNDGTLRQLLNTGNLRLIGHQLVVDSVMFYNSLTQQVSLQGNYYNDQFKKAFEYAPNLFDFSFLQITMDDKLVPREVMDLSKASFHLQTTDPVVIRNYVAYLIMQQNLTASYIMQLKLTRDYATRLIGLLHKNYHLEPEE